MFYSDTVQPFIDLMVSTLCPFVLLVLMDLAMIVKVIKEYREKGDSLTQAEKDRKSLCLMLLARCIAYFITNIPVCIILASDGWNISWMEWDLPLAAKWSLAWQLAIFLQYFNQAINLELFMVSAKFRREFVRMIRCQKDQTVVKPLGEV